MTFIHTFEHCIEDGWVVYGLLNYCSGTEVLVNLDGLVKQSYNHDFP